MEIGIKKTKEEFGWGTSITYSCFGGYLLTQENIFKDESVKIKKIEELIRSKIKDGFIKHIDDKENGSRTIELIKGEDEVCVIISKGKIAIQKDQFKKTILESLVKKFEKNIEIL